MPGYVYAKENASQNRITVYLLYPQKSNAPKRAPQRIEKPAVLKGDVPVDIAGIEAKQLKSQGVYVEYFLDNDLVYSTEGKDGKKAKIRRSHGFVLDTTRYPDGAHTLVVNLWDKNGPSAIGMRKITIKNGP